MTPLSSPMNILLVSLLNSIVVAGPGMGGNKKESQITMVDSHKTKCQQTLMNFHIIYSR